MSCPFALRQIPTSILRSSRVLMNEPPRGLKATLLLGLRSLATAPLSQGPTEKHRRELSLALSFLSRRLLNLPPRPSSVYLLACFLHAVIQERLTYEPLGWTKVRSDIPFRRVLFEIDASLPPSPLPGLRDQRLRARRLFPSYRHLPRTLHQQVQRRSNFPSLEVSQGPPDRIDLWWKAGRERRASQLPFVLLAPSRH